MDKLSSEIVIDILSRLPIKSLVRCRCVCKSWLHLTQELHLIDTHLSISSKNEIYCLILKSSIPIHITCWHSKLSFVQNDGTDDYKCVNFNFSLPLLHDYEIMGSCNGLLCLFDPLVKYLTHILNPCTGDFVFLPNPIRDLGDLVSVVVGFGFLPERNVYKMVEIVYYRRAIVDNDNDGLRSSVYVYTIGDDSWRFIGSAPYSLRDSYISEACVNGALHWVSSCYDGTKFVYQIVAFDLQNEVFKVIPHPDFDSGRDNYILGVLQGCLSATRHNFQDYVEIWVMKDYGVKESWTKCLKIVCSEAGLIIGAVQPLFFQRNGELILQHDDTLLCYNPLTKKLRELRISGMPWSFKAVIHVGSLVSPRKLLKLENTDLA